MTMKTDRQLYMQDCEDCMYNELRYGDNFCVTAEDTSTWDDYNMLSEADRKLCFKRAQKRK